MISGKDFYTVVTAMTPLYVAMILAYGSVRWWKIFSPDQCSGINRFVAVFAVPLLSFHFISTNDIYMMNFRFIAADTLQKIIMLLALGLWATFTKNGSLEWLITIFSVSTLPNTLVMGIPLLIAMYGDYAGSLMVQVVVMQCIIWYTLLLFLFEYRGAKMLIMEQFPETAASIVSFKVDSDVLSLDGRDFLETDAEIGNDGKLHVTVRKSNASRRSLGGLYHNNSHSARPSNLTGAEIYSLSSSRNPTPRGSNFNNMDFYSMMGVQGLPTTRHSNFGTADMYSVQSSRGPTPRPSNFDDTHNNVSSPRFGFYPAPQTQTLPITAAAANYPAPNPEIASSAAPTITNKAASVKSQTHVNGGEAESINKANSLDAKELHMFVWSSSASPVSEGRSALHVFGSNDFGASDQSGRADVGGAKEIRMLVSDPPSNAKANAADNKEHRRDEFAENFTFAGARDEGDESGPNGLNKPGSSSTAELHPKAGGGRNMPPASVMTRLILIMVWRKLIRNPNTYSSLIGLIWSLLSFRWHVHMPAIVKGSISILSDAGLGMAMFSLGLFMALQPKMIACGNSLATFAMAVRFLTGPAVMAAASIAIGLRGDLLRIAIVQAALPQGIVPFVFAKEYNVHPTILSTGVIFGMLIALPIDLLYYLLLGVEVGWFWLWFNSRDYVSQMSLELSIIPEEAMHPDAKATQAAT